MQRPGYIRWLVLPLGLLAGWATADNPPEESQYRAIVWMGGMAKVRQPYEIAVARLALEKTREEYGDYTLEMDDSPISTERAIRDMRKGEVINMASGPAWAVNFGDDPPLQVVPLPIAKGLLGYRLSVVRTADLEAFSAIETLEDLRQYTAGLGRDWLETPTFEHNQLPWFPGRDLTQLFSMLSRERFDYLPLGSLEAERSLAASGLADQLTIVPDLVIYYPLPVFLQVSVNRPALASRLEAGLRKAEADGSLDALFQEHYGELFTRLKNSKPTLITLENPDLPNFIQDKGPELLRSGL